MSEISTRVVLTVPPTPPRIAPEEVPRAASLDSSERPDVEGVIRELLEESKDPSPSEIVLATVAGSSMAAYRRLATLEILLAGHLAENLNAGPGAMLARAKVLREVSKINTVLARRTQETLAALATVRIQKAHFEGRQNER